VPAETRSSNAPVTAHLAYVDPSGRRTDRIVTVIGHRTHPNGRQYLVARDHRDGATKSFRIDRMLALVAIDTGEVLSPQSLIR